MYRQSGSTMIISPPHAHYKHYDVYAQPTQNRYQTTRTSHVYKRPGMSGFFSSEAERALMGEGQDAEILFSEQSGLDMSPGFGTAFIGDDSGWAHAHSDASGFDYFHPFPFLSQGVNEYDPAVSAGSAAGLQNYGTLNSDNRTWRCAYPGCSSKAIFARPCDLRKHFHRHSKNFYCRHEGCPQATHGGFSSKKDRVRHEAKHNPGIECNFPGCERIFSRMDNMKDHYKRIHKRSS